MADRPRRILIIRMKDRGRENLHGAALGILGLLAVQFILGMTLNLFMTFPTYPGNIVQSNDYALLFAQYPILLLHFVLGFLLLIATIAALVFSLRSAVPHMKIIGILGFLSVLFALISGLVFVHYAFQNNFYSYTMSLGFIAAILAYFAMFYLTKTKVNI